MKKILFPRILFALGFVLILIANVAVLTGVASNRSGDPESLVELTERELQMPYRLHEENSGLSLRLTWRAIGNNDDVNWGSPAWFDVKKLEELGFTVEDTIRSEETSKRHKYSVSKEAFIVLEHDGVAYRKTLKRAEGDLDEAANSFKINSEDEELRDSFERAQERLERERISASRLFAIDAGLEAGELRKRYSDRARFIITPGRVNLRYDYSNMTDEPFGYISDLSVENIHVPLNLRDVLNPIIARDKSDQNELKSPRYRIELAYGSRFEPWIRSVHHGTNEGP